MKSFNFRKIGLALMSTLTAFAFTVSLGAGSAHAAITSNLGIGSKSSQVTELQQFLANNAQIYPEGLVTGYYGALTAKAVVQFQAQYDIPQVGTVGPVTGAKINFLMAQGRGLDVNAAIITTPTVQTSNTYATVGWITNELATGQVYYDTNFIQSNEATSHNQLAYISGTLAYNSVLQTSQNITISNLQPNTTYYYVVRSIDASGNVSMTLPYTFHTNN